MDIKMAISLKISNFKEQPIDNKYSTNAIAILNSIKTYILITQILVL